MAQVKIHLPDRLEKEARRAAKADRKSLSRWIADQVLWRLEHSWPRGVLDAAGAIPDFPSLEELRRGYGPEASRDTMP